MKTKAIFKLSSIVFATLLLLTGCKNNSGNNSTQSSEGGYIPLDPTEYYNEENFIAGTKEVTETKVVTYDAPNLLKTSTQAKVSVEGQDLFVYETRVNDRRKFSWETPTRKVC